MGWEEKTRMLFQILKTNYKELLGIDWRKIFQKVQYVHVLQVPSEWIVGSYKSSKWYR